MEENEVLVGLVSNSDLVRKVDILDDFWVNVWWNGGCL